MKNHYKGVEFAIFHWKTNEFAGKRRNLGKFAEKLT